MAETSTLTHMPASAKTQDWCEWTSRSLGDIPKMDPTMLAKMPRMISTDSHVAEPENLWDALPERLRENVPKVKIGLGIPGATDPRLRLLDQEQDGLEAEVLFPNNGMALFGLDDVETQVAAMRIYNDWLADYCKAAPKNFFGIPCVSVYDIDGAIRAFPAQIASYPAAAK